VLNPPRHFASFRGPSRGQYGGHDNVVLATSSEETRRQLVKDWWSTQEDSEPAITIAMRRSDSDDLNDRARAVMAAAGPSQKDLGREWKRSLVGLVRLAWEALLASCGCWFTHDIGGA
jgi:hypothetical protein